VTGSEMRPGLALEELPEAEVGSAQHDAEELDLDLLGRARWRPVERRPVRLGGSRTMDHAHRLGGPVSLTQRRDVGPNLREVTGEGLIGALEAQLVELPEHNGAGKVLVVGKARFDVVGVGVDELVDWFARPGLGVRVVQVAQHGLAILADVPRARGHGPASFFQIA
jgi:hypothetical protein